MRGTDAADRMVGDRLLGGGLELRLERRVDLEPARAHGLEAVLVDQLFLDEVEEVLLGTGRVTVAAIEAEVLLLQLLGLVERDVALIGQCVEDLVAPLGRALRIAEGVVVGGRLRQPGEQRRLLDVEILHGLVEEDLRGGLDADRGAAVVGAVGSGVEVAVEDLVLRVLVLVLLRHRRLLDLARDRVLGVLDVEVADELLGDGRSALLDLPGLSVRKPGADDGREVDAAVLVEVLVLDRDRGLLEDLRDLLELDRLALDVVLDVAEAAAVSGEDLGVLALIEGLQGVDVGRVGSHVQDPDRAAAQRQCEHAEQDRECGHDLLADRPRSVPSMSRARGHSQPKRLTVPSHGLAGSGRNRPNAPTRQNPGIFRF